MDQRLAYKINNGTNATTGHSNSNNSNSNNSTSNNANPSTNNINNGSPNNNTNNQHGYTIIHCSTHLQKKIKK